MAVYSKLQEAEFASEVHGYPPRATNAKSARAISTP
jgi:hypothetical protein